LNGNPCHKVLIVSLAWVIKTSKWVGGLSFCTDVRHLRNYWQLRRTKIQVPPFTSRAYHTCYYTRYFVSRSSAIFHLALTTNKSCLFLELELLVLLLTKIIIKKKLNYWSTLFMMKKSMIFDWNISCLNDGIQYFRVKLK
jgi:hypothetical protein